MTIFLVFVLIASILITVIKPRFYERLMFIDRSQNILKWYYFIWLVLFVFSIVSSPPSLEKLNEYLKLGFGNTIIINKVDNIESKPLSAEEKTVTKIIDGDTLVVSGGDHVRLLGIDADEPEGPCYQEAKNRLKELVYGRKVELRPDLSGVDQYGRQLRYVYLNNENINFKLVSEGLAICRFYPDNPTFKSECAKKEISAINSQAGCLWQVPKN